MRVKIQVDGLQKAMRDIDKFGDDFKKILGPTVLKGADMIRDEARSRARGESAGGLLNSGELAQGIISQVTWDKNASKAFAAAGMDKGMNSRFVYHTKSGVRYYIPSAIEYGHRAPGGGGYVVLATNKAGELVSYKRGKKKGQLKAAASSKQNKVAKPKSFMRKTFKAMKVPVSTMIQARMEAFVRGATK